MTMHRAETDRGPSATLAQRCADLVVELGLGRASDLRAATPLTGGVGSDIALVTLPDRRIVAKFALPKLKVEADWRAPVHRNAAEYAWLGFARACCPRNAPALFGHSPTLQGFAMEYLGGPNVYLWKSALLGGAPSKGEAGKVGLLLGRLHAASTSSGFDPAPFRNGEDFRALRLEPYLSFSAARNPAVAGRLASLADALHDANRVLVHGDVSPKNILVRDGEPILLDAECACMGDASFDLAFCLNHLVLKAIHLPESRRSLLAQVGEFWSAYRPQIAWEDPAALESRTVALLPALMLARVDGRSPVEYLRDDERRTVRALALPLIAAPAATLSAFLDRLGERLP